jgi:hypothetical protein
METTRLKINGIVRNKARNEFQDGDCQEIINMRYRDGAWRPIAPPEQVGAALSNEYDRIRIHVAEGIRNYIGIRGNGIYIIDLTTGTDTLIEQYESDVDVQFIKRMMIVTGGAAGVFVWKGENYESVVSYAPSVSIVETGHTLGNTGEATTAEGLIGKYRAKMNELSNDGYISGSIAIRLAWKLYDGSFIRHTIPSIQIGAGDYRINRSTTGSKPYNIRQIPLRKLNAKYVAFGVNPYDNLDTDIYTSLCIFMSKAETEYKIDEDTITDDLLTQSFPSGTVTKFLSDIGVDKNDDVSKLSDVPSWYLVKEIDLSELKGANVIYEDEIDLKRFYDDYASRQVLPVDSFSHHVIQGETAFVYNDRLILGGITTTFGQADTLHIGGLFGFPGYTDEDNVVGLVRVVIKTDNGEKYSYSQPTSIKILGKDGKYYVCFYGINYNIINPLLSYTILGYQDARASRIDVLLNTATEGEYNLFGSLTLKKSAHDNFAYFHNDDYTPVFLENTSYGPVITLTGNDTLIDNNRVQVSELRNPLVYPARLSYQVGTGSILAFGANTEPLSTGQFGQYPLIVFTSKGVWALEQGQGDVIFAAISPVSGDVAINKDHVVSIGDGVVFTTKRGVFALSGKQLAQLSEKLEGAINQDIIGYNQFSFFVDNPNLVQLSEKISDVDALTYILSASVGFDKVNNELYFSNSDYDYTYIFNFESNSWHKVGGSYGLFVNDYPTLLGITENGVFDLGLHTAATHTPVLILTEPQSLTANELYKKIERLALRCTIGVESARYLTLAVFASDDLIRWQLITGAQRNGQVQNVLISRSHCSAQYYVLLIAGSVTMESNITGIEVTISGRLNRKLRK